MLVSGCGDTDAPLEIPGPEVKGGAVGPDVRVNDDLKLLQVQIEFPLDGVYEEGEDARLFLAISNTDQDPDTLVDVSGPDFASAVSEGGGERQDVAIEVPGNDTVYIGAEGEPALILTDLDRSLRSSQSIPVTFTFERAGEATVDATVAAEGPSPAATYDFQDPAEDPTGDGPH
jgi:copper(I)-binding protein